MAPFASLPQEIVDTFVDELAVLSEAGASGSGDNAHVVKGNLRSCMQVSRLFRTRARRHLFSDVTLVVRVNQASTKSSRDFRILLDGDPSLAKEVSSLKIDLMDYPSEPVNSKILAQSSPNLTVKDRHLPSILGKLRSLRMLGLASLHPTDASLAFNPPIQAAIFKLHEYPLIETVELSGNNLSLPIEFVSRWTTLKSVIIHGSPFIRPIIRDNLYRDTPRFPVPRYIKDRKFPQVKSLFLRFGSLSFSIADEEGFLRHLSDLKAEIHRPFDWRWLWEVMQMRCTTLKTVFIRNLLCGSLPSKFIPFFLTSESSLHVDRRSCSSGRVKEARFPEFAVVGIAGTTSSHPTRWSEYSLCCSCDHYLLYTLPEARVDSNLPDLHLAYCPCISM